MQELVCLPTITRGKGEYLSTVIIGLVSIGYILGWPVHTLTQSTKKHTIVVNFISVLCITI